MSTDSFSQALRTLTITKGSYTPPRTDHLDPNTFEFFCYFNSGSMVSPCFLCNPLKAPELAHLAGFFLNTWHGLAMSLEFALHPYFPLECEGDIAGVFQITFLFVGQELRTFFAEPWGLCNFFSVPLLQKQKTDGSFWLCQRASPWHTEYLTLHPTKQSPRPFHYWGSWRLFFLFKIK